MEKSKKLGASALLLILNSACGGIQPAPERPTTEIPQPTRTLTYDPLNPNPNDESLWTCNWNQPPADAGTRQMFIDTWGPKGENPLRIWWAEAGCQLGPGVKPNSAKSPPQENVLGENSAAIENQALAFIETHTNSQEAINLLKSQFNISLQSDQAPSASILWAIYYSINNLPPEIKANLDYFPKTIKIYHTDTEIIGALLNIKEPYVWVDIYLPHNIDLKDWPEKYVNPNGKTGLIYLIGAIAHEFGHAWLYTHYRPDWGTNVSSQSPTGSPCDSPIKENFDCSWINDNSPSPDEEYWSLYFGILATNPDSVPEYIKQTFRVDFPNWR